MATFTCITCRVSFVLADAQREHYKGEWHRYNLKRKVAELPPIKEDEFIKKLGQAEESKQEPVISTCYCECCSRNFLNAKAYENHVNSKKHKENAKKPAKDKLPKKNPNLVEKKNGDTLAADIVASDDDGDSDWEDVDSDDEDEESNALTAKQCLFCNHDADSMEDNLNHMTRLHSFFIPDLAYVVDMQGLLEYLGAKVGDGNICLLCNERGKSFYSLDAVRKHMIDKQHCRIFFEDDGALEFSDFYDFSSTYPDEDDANEDVDVSQYKGSILEVDPCTMELVLPSGSRLGHKSLQYIYRQGLGLHEFFKSTHYQIRPNNNASKVAMQRKRNQADRIKNKHVKLGVSANKLQHHFRCQVIF